MTARIPPRALDPEDLAPGQYLSEVVAAGGVRYVTLVPPTWPPALVPLTTSVAGEPALVWDADDNLMMVEEPR